MATHPLNLAVRFVLELAALYALGLWGWRHGDGVWRFVIAAAIPLIAAALWGTFAVPGDPSRSGSAPVPVAGVLRLALELGFFAAATLALYDLGYTVADHDLRRGRRDSLRALLRSDCVADLPLKHIHFRVAVVSGFSRTLTRSA